MRYLTLNHIATFFPHAVIHKIGVIRLPLLPLLKCHEDLEQSCGKTRKSVTLHSVCTGCTWLTRRQELHPEEPAPSRAQQSPSQQTGSVFHIGHSPELLLPHITHEEVESLSH